MRDFIVDGGIGIYPVIVFGLMAIALAARYAAAPKKGDLALLVGVGVATLLLGSLGTVIGIQASARYITEAPDKWLFLVGLKESLNVMVTALVATTFEVLIATYGALKLARASGADQARA
jgi:hypothetical protein